MRFYPYAFGEVPLGEYEAVLDFKVWAKKIMAIGCYFTQAITDKKFQLTVYCSGTGIYRIKDCPIDFTECPIGRLYRITVDADQKKKIRFVNAALL
jgi:hypothetical protein